jgi:hypothetical protein
MTKGETIGLGVLALGALYVFSKPRTAVPAYPPTPLPSGGSQTAVIVGGITSIIDSLTGALAGQSSGY